MYAADIVASLFNASERSGSAKGGRVGLEVASHWELKTTTKEKGFAELQTLRDVYEAIALQLKDMLAGDLEMKQLGAGRPRRRRPKPPGPPAGKPNGQQAVAT